MEKKEVYICQQQPYFEEDKIDLKELFKTIWLYKNFIVGFTFIFTILAVIYAFMKKPIYQIESFVEMGYYNSNSNSNSNRVYFIEPNNALILIKNEFIQQKELPNLNTILFAKGTQILDLKIDAYSNEKARDYLNKIVNYLQNKEKLKIELFIKTINSKIVNLENYKKILKNRVKILDKKISPNLNPTAYQSILNNISKLNDKIFNINNQIIDLKSTISSLNITKTHIIGKIVKSDYPIKPKKKLIGIVAFITSFILSIFLVFFIEFIKSTKEEEK